jgi:transcriptional regulator with XRE-family HTH domain
MNKFGKRLDSLRENGEPKKEFAKRIGISPVQLSKYYHGVKPGRNVLERICENTGASMDWLLGEDKYGTPLLAVKLKEQKDKELSDEQKLKIALSYIDQMESIKSDGRKMIKEFVNDVASGDQCVDDVKMYYKYVKSVGTRYKGKKNN